MPDNPGVEFFDDRVKAERSQAGHFLFRKRVPLRWEVLESDEWLRALPNYETTTECLMSDTAIAPLIGRLVGTPLLLMRLDADNILRSLITHAMVDDEGHAVFANKSFDDIWREWTSFFGSEKILIKTIAPLPYLVAPFPLRLNGDLALDALTDDEMTRCYQTGLLRPEPGFPFLPGEAAVGLRMTSSLPKMVLWPDEHLKLKALKPLATSEKGVFGRRPFGSADLAIADFLTALRLFLPNKIQASGSTSWVDWPLGGRNYINRISGWKQVEKSELQLSDVPDFLRLWRLLEQKSKKFEFSLHRFNLAFDRGSHADRIVDLITAAEALFLKGIKKEELKFRLALRAAKFATHPIYSEREVFGILSQAYDVRSAFVHGGALKTKDTRLPHEPTSLSTFIDAVEDIIRLALCKALSMEEDVLQEGYWESLLFSNPLPT